MAILICFNLYMIIHITALNYLDLICMIDDIFELLLQWQDLHTFMDHHLLLSLCVQTKLSWGSKKLRACFQFAFKKKLTSCTLRENKIIHQTKLDSSTQNPKQRENVLQKTKSCTRLNWTTALKIPEQRGTALQITNLNIENIRTSEPYLSPSHLINSKKLALNTEPHWFLVHNSFVPFAGCLV